MNNWPLTPGRWQDDVTQWLLFCKVFLLCPVFPAGICSRFDSSTRLNPFWAIPFWQIVSAQLAAWRLVRHQSRLIKCSCCISPFSTTPYLAFLWRSLVRPIVVRSRKTYGTPHFQNRIYITRKRKYVLSVVINRCGCKLQPCFQGICYGRQRLMVLQSFNGALVTLSTTIVIKKISKETTLMRPFAEFGSCLGDCWTQSESRHNRRILLNKLFRWW